MCASIWVWKKHKKKHRPFIVSLKVDKPAVDCELEPNNQSAVVSIVMLSPMGKRMAKGTHDSLHDEKHKLWTSG